MIPLQLPFAIFKTRKQMDDYGANDMRYGDLSEEQLKSRYHLIDVSSRVDPYLLTKTSPSGQPQSMFYSPTAEVNEKLTVQECASILFDEFRHLSISFSLYGPYKHLIEKMITHMQKSHGSPFHDTMLDRALNEQILGDKSPVNSTLILIKNALQGNID